MSRTAMIVVWTAFAWLLGAAVAPAAPEEPFEGWSRARIEAATPSWPNPFLAFLPAGAEPDMDYWRARMQMEAHDRRLHRSATRRTTATEHEPPGTVGGNDHPRVGEPLSGVGTTPWTVHEVAVSGDLRDEPADGGFAAEPDDTIDTAAGLAVAAGSRIAVAGVIGDGIHGAGGPSPSGDFDFFEVALIEGQRVEILVETPEPMEDLDPVVALYSPGGGLIAFNDNLPQSGFVSNLDAWLSLEAPWSGAFRIAVGGHSPSFDQLPTDPFDGGSGPGAGSEGDYRLIVGIDAPAPGDVDCYRVAARAGDVLGATVSGATGVAVLTPDGDELVATSGGDLSGVYPPASTLPGGGGGTVARTVDADGELAVCVSRLLFYQPGDYLLELRLDRSPLDATPSVRRQVLYLDFDGAVVEASDFGAPPGQATLSPLSAFLAGWGLGSADEDAVIDGVVQVVRENLEGDVRALGGNGDAAATGLAAEFDIEIRTSRDEPDPGDAPDVARLVIGGSITQLGVATVGIAEHIDPGNFDTAGTAVVLLDLLSAPAPNPTSLNTVDRAPGVPLIEVVVEALGNIVAHEAGHLFGNFHTERDAGPPTIMDVGGDLLNVLGAGDDDVAGSADDLDVDLGPDAYSPREVFRGVENTLEAVSFGLPLGGARPRIAAAPPVLVLGPAAVGAPATGVVRFGNVGTAPLAVGAAALGGAAPDRFDVISGGTAVTLPPDGAADVVVEFTAVATGAVEAALEVATDDPGAAAVTVPLEGRGGVPSGSVTPENYDFGTLVYGDPSSSIELDVTVTNSGSGPLTADHAVLSGGTSGRFAIDAGGAPFVVAAGASRTVRVAFRPGGEVGTSSTTLVVLADDPATPRLDVALEGFADGPDISITPPSPYVYGEITLGETRRRDFVVGNVGTRDLHGASAMVTGDAGAGFVVVFGGGPFTVAPEDTHEIRVTTTPTAEGEYEGELVISSDDPDEPAAVVELVVACVIPELTASPGGHDFGPVRVGETPSVRFVIRNVGEGRLRVDPPSLAGPDASAFAITGGAAGVTLPPDELTAIDVEFRPASAGAASAALVVDSNDPDTPQVELPLTGAGALPVLALTKSCRGGASPECTVEVANLGAVAAVGVVVEDVLPTDLVWMSDDCGAGPPTGTDWIWPVGELDADGRRSCTLGFGIAPGAVAPIVNEATVRWDGTPAGQVDDWVTAIVPLAAPVPAAGPVGWALLVALLAAAGVAFVRRR